MTGTARCAGGGGAGVICGASGNVGLIGLTTTPRSSAVILSVNVWSWFWKTSN